MAKNKIIYGGEVLIDLTTDTVTADKVQVGYYFHGRDGIRQQGANTYDADTSDANASDAELLLNRTAYVNGNKITGAMPNNGAVSGNIATKEGSYTIPQGYHDGSGSVVLNSVEKQKLIAGNIKAGISLFGIEGSYTGEGVSAQSKTATPSTSQQTILPDTGYDYLSQVVVNAIPYVESPNTYGTTVTIG